MAIQDSPASRRPFRALGPRDSAMLRLGYKRNTVDVDEAVNQLKAQKTPIKAVVMVSTYRAAAKFIEKTRDLYPGMIYSNVSFVGSTALADELMLLGARYRHRRNRHPSGAGGFRLFESWFSNTKGACQIFSRRGARLRVA